MGNIEENVGHGAEQGISIIETPEKRLERLNGLVTEDAEKQNFAPSPETSESATLGTEIPESQLNMGFNITPENVAAFTDYMDNNNIAYDIYHYEGKPEEGFIAFKDGWSQKTKDEMFIIAQGLDTTWGWTTQIKPENKYYKIS